MQRLRNVVAALRAFVRRDEITQEIREEMEFHLDMRTAENERRGLSAAEARQAANRRFGNRLLMQERGYDVRAAGWAETLLQDLQFSLRLLRRERGFTFVALVTLALAIGVSTALFSVIDAALLRPLPYPESDRLVELLVSERENDGQWADGMAPSFTDLQNWRSSSLSLVSIAQARERTFEPVIVDSGLPERVVVGQASAGFLGTLGLAPATGREFVTEDTDAAVATVALVSYDYWQSRFAGNASVLGQSIRVDGAAASIIGVMPRDFYPFTAVWRPMLRPNARMIGMRGSGTPTYARLRPGVSPDQAADEITSVARKIALANNQPDTFYVRVLSLHERTVARYRRTLYILIASVSVVWFIACINVSSLLLARGTSRQAELSVRASIGAGRRRLVRQLLTESLVLALAGGVCGFVLGGLVLDGLVSILPLSLPENSPPVLNSLVLFFAIALSTMTAIAIGIWPAFRLSQERLNSALVRTGHTIGSALSVRAGQAVIALEVALAIVLLTSAGLLTRSFGKALAIDVGFEPASYLTMEVFPVDQRPGTERVYFDRLVESLGSVPGIEAAGYVDLLPLGDAGSYTDATANDISVFVSVKEMSVGYLNALGLALQSGRLPEPADGFAIAVLSESAARRLFPGAPAVGRQFLCLDRSYTVSGVVRDIRSRDLFSVDTRPDIYLSVPAPTITSEFDRTPKIVVRPTHRSAVSADDLRRAAVAVGQSVIVERIRSGSEWVGDNLERSRDQTMLLGLLSGLGLALTLVGIFGVTSYAVSRRTQEIGIRIAFGASTIQVVRTMVSGVTSPLLVGTAVGLTGSYYATVAIQALLFETTPHDPATFAGVGAAMAATALCAAWLPAVRAARVDPVAALRAE